MRDDIVQHVQSVGHTVRGTVVRNKRGTSTPVGKTKKTEATPLLKRDTSGDSSSDEEPVIP